MNREIAGRIRRYVAAQFPEQVEFLKQLVQAESPSLEPETHRRVLEVLAGPLASIDFEARVLRGRHSGGMLYARPRRRVRLRPLQLLLGHADTVWPTGTLQRMPLTRDGKFLKGPGVYDMKAGLAQMLFALKALVHSGIPIEVTPVVLISCDEELGSEDSRNLIQFLARRVIRVLVPEPAAEPRGQLKTSRKGVGLFTLTVRGRSAHAGVEPEKGASAIVELATQILRLQEFNQPEAGLTVNVGIVEGGSRPNIVPDFAQATIDVRVASMADAHRITERIRGLRPSRPEIRIEVAGGLDRPPMEPTPANRQLWDLARELGLLLDLELEESSSGGGSDGNLTSPFTATLDGLGAVGGGAHAAHEYVDLDYTIDRTSLLALLLAAPPDSLSRPR